MQADEQTGDKPSDARPRANRWPAVTLWIVPIALLALSLVSAPGFIMPFLNHPIAKIILVLTLIWHSICCGLLYLSYNLGWHVVFRVLICILVFFSTTWAALVPMLGPAVITIIQALGPVYGTDKQ